MLLVHCARRAASRAAWTAGKSKAINTAMMAITTRSSISVNPRRILVVLISNLRSKRKNDTMPTTDKPTASRWRFPLSLRRSGFPERSSVNALPI